MLDALPTRAFRRAALPGARLVCARLVCVLLAAGCGGGGSGGDDTTDVSDSGADAGDVGPISGGEGPGDDWDGDGILNRDEDLNRNGTYDEGSNETDWRSADTDGDTIPDGVEDANRNGQVDRGETDPRLADTDGDGIPDNEEPAFGTDALNPDTDGDGIPDGIERDVTGTDPLREDTDGDGLPDGDEDRNFDGVLDPNETSPTNPDTDGDGIPDAQETIPIACARSSEPATVVFEDREGDWTLTLPSAFEAYADYGEVSGDDRLLRGAWFASIADGVYGFVVSKAPDPTVRNGVQQAESETARFARRQVRVLDRSTSATQNWDGSSGAVSSLRWALRSGAMTVSEARDDFAASLLNVDSPAPRGAPEASGASGERFEAFVHVAYRSRSRVVIVGVVTLEGASADSVVARLISDVSDGTAGAQFDDSDERACGPQAIEELTVPVDFLWVVDSSESMLDDRETVASTADVFFTTLDRSFLDFRVGVVSTNMRNNEWLLVQPGFSADITDFREQVLHPPVQFGQRAFEFGIATATNVIAQASSAFAERHTGWRRGAKRILIFLADEDDQSTKDLGRDDPDCDASVDQTLQNCDYVTDFVNLLQAERITAYAITGDLPSGCASFGGPGFAEEAGAAYIRAAYESGGSFASICAEDLSGAVDTIIRSSFGAVAQYELPDVPITSTLRVVRNGELLLRSTSEGWDYDAVNNSIVFHGAARPALGDELALGYRRYLDTSEDPSGWIPPE